MDVVQTVYREPDRPGSFDETLSAKVPHAGKGPGKANYSAADVSHIEAHKDHHTTTAAYIRFLQHIVCLARRFSPSAAADIDEHIVIAIHDSSILSVSRTFVRWFLTIA